MNRDKSKKSIKSILVKKGERLSAKRNTVVHNAENLGLVPVLEPYSDKDSTMEQEFANCHAVYDVATYRKRKCVS